MESVSKRENLSSDELQELFGKDDSDPNTNALKETNDKNDDPQFVSKFQSSMMLARFCVGSGLFSIPSAFRHSGILLGILWLLLNGFLMAYGMIKLAKLSEEVSKRTGSSSVHYGDLGEECTKEAFKGKGGKFGRILVNFAIILACFALVCTQIIFIAEIWKQGFEQLGIQEMEIGSWILVVYCFLFPLSQIRRPSILAECSLLANALTLIGTITIFVHIFSTKFQRNTNDWWSENKVYWTKLPLTIGVTFYAYQLVAPFVVTMKNVMQEPSKMSFVINSVMIFVTVLYSVLGASGYASCFPECKDSIILNLPERWYYSVVKIFLGLASTVGTVLGMFVCFNIVQPFLQHFFPENRFIVASVTSRIFFLTLAAGITAAFPDLGNVMSLAGTLTNPILSLIFPSLGHLALFYKTLSWTNVAKDITLLCCGLSILVIGVYSSIYHMVYDIKFSPHP